MAEIDIQRRKRNILPWILGLILLGLVIWGLMQWMGGDDVDTATVPVVEDSFTAVPDTAADLIPVIVIATQPAQHSGQTVSGTARVAEVISDRGFWIEQDGQRLFVVIDEPVPETIDINAGQTVRLTGTVYTAQTIDQVPGELELDARQAIQDLPAFLYVRARDISITDRP